MKPVEVVGSIAHDMLLRGLEKAIRRLIEATQNCPDFPASAVKLVAACEHAMSHAISEDVRVVLKASYFCPFGSFPRV